VRGVRRRDEDARLKRGVLLVGREDAGLRLGLVVRRIDRLVRAHLGQAEVLEILAERREVGVVLRPPARDANPVVRRGEAELRPGAGEYVRNAPLRGGVVRAGDARLALLKRARLDGAVDGL